MRTSERDFTASSLYQKVDQVVSDVFLGAQWLLASLPVVTLVPATAALFMAFDHNRIAPGSPSPAFLKNFLKVAWPGIRLTMRYMVLGGGIAAVVALLGAAGLPSAVVGGMALTWSAAFAAIVFTGIGIFAKSPAATRIASLSVAHAFANPLRSLKLVLWLVVAVLLTMAIPLSLAPIGSALSSCYTLRRCNQLLDPKASPISDEATLHQMNEWISPQPGSTRIREGG